MHDAVAGAVEAIWALVRQCAKHTATWEEHALPRIVCCLRSHLAASGTLINQPLHVHVNMSYVFLTEKKAVRRHVSTSVILPTTKNVMCIH